MPDIEFFSATDEILGALARADELLEQGLSTEDVCRRLGMTPETYCVWRRAHSRTFVATARRLEALEQVHAQLVELLTGQQQEIRRLQRLLERRTPDPHSSISG